MTKKAPNEKQMKAETKKNTPNQDLQEAVFTDFYNGKVMDHFLNPRHTGRLSDYDAIGEVGNVVCGDVMRIFIKVEEDNHKEKAIANISFETYGCGAAIATSSITCEMAMGKTLTEALKIEKSDVVSGLGSLPPQKIHCSILAVDALREAIYVYLNKHKLPIDEKLELHHQTIVKNQEILKKQYDSWLS